MKVIYTNLDLKTYFARTPVSKGRVRLWMPPETFHRFRQLFKNANLLYREWKRDLYLIECRKFRKPANFARCNCPTPAGGVVQMAVEL